jgi:hypothetical protein
VLTARVRAHEIGGRQLYSASRRRAVIRRLGCLAAPPERHCHGIAAAHGLNGIWIDAAGGGATCDTAQRVLTAVGRWVDDRSADLGARKHRDNLGFRCTVAQVGEADWTITCKRGREVVRGSVSA